MAACPAKEDANNNINAPAACTPPTVIVDKRVDMLLEWLCLHLAEDELPKGFDPRGRMLDVIRPGQNFTEATTTATTTGRTGPTDIGGLGLTSKVETLGEDSVGDGSKSRTTKGEKGNVRGVGDSGEEEEEEEEDAKLGEAGERIGPLERRLLQYGFGRAEVIRAVATQGQAAHAGVPRGNDKEDTDDGEDALDARLLGTLGILAQGLNAGSRTTSGAGGRIQDGVGDQSEAEALEATDEEVTSLEAIYGNDVVVAPTMPKVRGARSEWARRVRGSWRRGFRHVLLITGKRDAIRRGTSSQFLPISILLCEGDGWIQNELSRTCEVFSIFLPLLLPRIHFLPEHQMYCHSLFDIPAVHRTARVPTCSLLT